MSHAMRARNLAAILATGAAIALSACVRRNTGTAAPVIAAGGGHTCRATAAGVVECWGLNDAGQVGIGRVGSAVTVMSPVAGLTGVTAIAAGLRKHTCAVAAGGAVMCWGQNNKGQLGNASTTSSSTPVNTGVSGAIDVATGAEFSCAVKTGGEVWCWGDNTNGQFGNGTVVSSTTPVNTTITGATRVSAGFAHACAIMTAGTVSCWGTGPLGTDTSSKSQVPLQVPGITNAAVIAGGLTNTCVALQTGAVQCWGPNAHGELGNGTTTESKLPTPVTGVTGATALAVGGSHACAVVAAGAVQCWGDNSLSQLGLGQFSGPMGCGNTGPACSLTALAVRNVINAVDVAAGDSHTCAVLSDDRVKCWGWNGSGQLGTGQYGNGGGLPRATRPVFATPIAVAAGGNLVGANSCALLAAGTVKCWGYNGAGAVGNGGTNLIQSSPAAAQGLTTATSISVGGHSCATLDNQKVQCWGSNNFGELGAAAAQPHQTTPIDVPGLFAVAGVTAGRLSTCAIRADMGGMRELRCWGVNNNGQLGVSATGMGSCSTLVGNEPCTSTPMLIPFLRAVAVGGGSEHTCAVLDDGTVRCWGQNAFNQLGNTGGNAFAPVTVAGITNAIGIAVADFHNCALIADGTVQCWGRNRSGQMGNGTTLQSGIPTTVNGISNAIAVAAAGDHSCALLDDGTVKCWGDNGVGQLGQGTVTGPDFCAANSTMPCSKTPLLVPGISTATALASSVSGGHICVALANRTVMCWGGNAAGELGRGTSGNVIATPGLVIGL
jgi:alpha-tubulin suppressor-like RCC1 family protein